MPDLSKADIQSLPTNELWALMRLPLSKPSACQQLSWAKDELIRRYAARGVRLIGM